jgi:hypothetical protein
LLAAIDAVVEKPAPVQAKPVYSRMNLQGALEAHLGLFLPLGDAGARCQWTANGCTGWSLFI